MTSKTPVIPNSASNSAQGSQFQPLVQDTTVSAVNNVANNHFNTTEQLSPISAHLNSAVSEENRLQELYNEAYALLETNPLAARDMLINLIIEIPNDNAYFFILVACQTKLASTYPEGSEEREQIEKKLGNMHLQELGSNETTSLINTTESLIKECTNEMTSLINTTASQVKDRTSDIPILFDFYAKLDEGDSLEPVQARAIYNEALEMIKGQDELDYVLAQTFGLMSVASTYKSGGTMRVKLALEAGSQILAAYKRKEELFTNDKSKLAALDHFILLFNKFIRLFPNIYKTQLMLQKKFAECEKEIALLKGPAEKKVPSHTNSPRVNPKVTKTPVSSWKTARIILGFTFAAAFFTGAFFLGRRFIRLFK